MPVLAIFSAPAMTKKQYDSLRPIVKWETEVAAGDVFHAAGFDEKGGLHVADVWNSPEEMQTFVETRLMPGLKKLGIAPPEVQVFPLHNANVFPAADKFRVKTAR